MIVPGSTNPMAGVDDGGYLIERSLRTRATASAYLSRTYAGSGNLTTWTLSFWTKRNYLASQQIVYGVRADVNNYHLIWWDTSDRIVVAHVVGGITQSQLITTPFHRDVNSWYHIVWTWDTTNGTAADRQRLYVNGTRITAFDTAINPGASVNGAINTAVSHQWCRDPWAASSYNDGYLSHIHFIDGQALDPSYFGTTLASTGTWRPKRYSGNYGTNGYWLPFSDTTSTTTLMADASGNNNNFTATNISLSAGETYDSVVDTPTNNHCTMSSLANAGGHTIYWGGMRVDSTVSSGDKWVFGSYTIPTSGKWYWEVKVASGGTTNGRCGIGIVDGIHEQVGVSTPGISVTAGAIGATITCNGGTLNTASLGTLSANDILCFGYDADNSQLFITKSANINTAVTATVTAIASTANGGFRPALFEPSSLENRVTYWNFGQQPFVYTKPAGYRTLCATDLSEPAVKKPTKFFDVRTYTGNGTSPRAIISDLSFGPDITWVKRRNIANTSHALTARFASTGNVVLSPDTSAAMVGTNGAVTSWDNNGITVQTGSTDFAFYNTNASNYVAYNWYSGYWIEHNYLKWSEDISKAQWVKTGTATTSVNATTAPDGASTADEYLCGATPFSQVYQTYTSSPGNSPMCASVYLKAGTTPCTQCRLILQWSGSVTEQVYVDVNTTNGAYINSGVLLGSPTSAGYAIQNIGSGWYRVSVWGNGATAGNNAVSVSLSSANANQTFYMWGMMANYGLAASNYLPTGNSPAFRNAYPGTGTGVSYYEHTNGTATEVYHGLNVSPDFVFLKNRNATGDWMVFHKDMGGTMGDTYMRFNFVNQSTTGGGCSVDASKVTVGSGYATAQGHIHTFKSIEGFSKFGKYTGNNSANGPFVNCGFRPALVMIKRVDASGYWYLFDNKRDPDNVVDVELYANSNSVEATAAHLVDFLSNGFKIRSGAAWTEGNASGGTYIFAAWAEAPFKYALAR